MDEDGFLLEKQVKVASLDSVGDSFSFDIEDENGKLFRLQPMHMQYVPSYGYMVEGTGVSEADIAEKTTKYMKDLFSKNPWLVLRFVKLIDGTEQYQVYLNESGKETELANVFFNDGYCIIPDFEKSFSYQERLYELKEEGIGLWKDNADPAFKALTTWAEENNSLQEEMKKERLSGSSYITSRKAELVDADNVEKIVLDEIEKYVEKYGETAIDDNFKKVFLVGKDYLFSKVDLEDIDSLDLEKEINNIVEDILQEGISVHTGIPSNIRM